MDIFLKKSKVCCISDIHIGVHQNSILWLDIATNWAKWLREELNKKDISDIIISGDFFHYRDEIAVNTIHFVTDILKIWEDFNIIMLVGNHDAYYKDRSDVNSLSILKGWKNITVISKLETEILFNKHVTFCPWGTRLEDIPDSDIIFGHFEIQTFKQNAFKICAEGMTTKNLLTKSPLTISGHFHLREERVYDNGKILYLGNPFQMDFGDVDSIKGYYILDIPSSEYEFTENRLSPKHKKIQLSELVKIGDITPDVRENFKNNFIKFIIDMNISPDDVDALLRKLTPLNPLNINVDYAINFNKYQIDEDVRTDFTGIDIKTAISEFISMLDIQNKEEVERYTVDLYKKCT
tara:strand:+ start:5494 stop:6546 length:1053 start_codon:yes stop_codon:yes gene_type:complete